MSNLKDTQEALIKILSSRKNFEAFQQKGGMLGQTLGSICPDRAKQYFNDIASRRLYLTQNCYALTLRVLGKAKKDLVEKYWSNHGSSIFNPVFELADFPEFLRDEFQETNSIPYLIDLAHYEWLRRSVMINPSAIEKGQQIDLDSLEQRRLNRPFLNSTLLLREFNYPVHTIANRVAAGRWKKHSYAARKFYLAAYQDPEQRSAICVRELGEFAFCLLSNAREKSWSYDQLLQGALELAVEESTEEIIDSAIEMLQQFEQCGIFRGSRQCKNSPHLSLTQSQQEASKLGAWSADLL